ELVGGGAVRRRGHEESAQRREDEEEKDGPTAEAASPAGGPAVTISRAEPHGAASASCGRLLRAGGSRWFRSPVSPPSPLGKCRDDYRPTSSILLQGVQPSTPYVRHGWVSARMAHRIPAIKNGPYGTYVFSEIRRTARSTPTTTPARSAPVISAY